MSLSPSQRRTRARIGAHALHASRDGVELTEKARATFLASFEHEVDPDGVLEADERGRRARHALQAHMSRLSLAASRARSARRQGAST